MHIVTRDNLPLFIFFLEKLLRLYSVGFVTKEFLDLHRVDELRDFAVNILLKLVC